MANCELISQCPLPHMVRNQVIGFSESNLFWFKLTIVSYISQLIYIGVYIISLRNSLNALMPLNALLFLSLSLSLSLIVKIFLTTYVIINKGYLILKG